MLKTKQAFSGFSVNNLEKARAFYADILGLQVSDAGAGLGLQLPGGGTVFVYPKNDHQPATFTILDFEVDSIDEAVDELRDMGVQFECYDGIPADEKGIARGIAQKQGPDIAWFKDPAGNILAVLEMA
jgi:catechol 2,3-dioxygenase-like lactoylglutathione lyase family enzyme